MVDIRTNLLRNRPTLSEKEYRRERTWLRASVFSLVIVVVIVVALSVWNIILSQKIASVEAQIQKSSTDMQGYVDAGAQQIYLKSRLQLIMSFLQQRTVAREALQRVFSTSIPGTHVSSVSFTSDNMLAIQITADSALAFKAVSDYYQADTGYFIQVVSNGVSRAKDGTYQLSLNLTLPKAGGT